MVFVRGLGRADVHAPGASLPPRDRAPDAHARHVRRGSDGPAAGRSRGGRRPGRGGRQRHAGVVHEPHRDRPSPSPSGPGCGSPRTSRSRRSAASSGTVQVTSIRCPELDDDAHAVEARRGPARTASGRAAGRRTAASAASQASCSSMSPRIASWTTRPAVDHVERDGLAGVEVHDRRHVGVVAGDDVDLARRGAGARGDRRRGRGRRRRRSAATRRRARRRAARAASRATAARDGRDGSDGRCTSP